MKFAMIGLGKMGMNLVKNAVDHDMEVVAYDLERSAVEEIQQYSSKVKGAFDIDDLLTKLSVEQAHSPSTDSVAPVSRDELTVSPKIIWVMVPAGHPTNSTIDELTEKLSVGDIIIDGGNSNYKDNLLQNKILAEKGIRFFDAGTSGGMEGARQGGNFMIGGDDKEAWQVIEPIFQAIAQEGGYLYTGKLGSGHYLKMIHNGIEYGMMQAIAEGFEILEASPFDYDYEAVAKLWNHGSVIRSWLMELAEEQFAKDPKLDEIIGRVQSSGEGKWTIEESLDLRVPAPVIALSLMMRNRSLQDDTMTGKVVAALRNGFGGHDIERK
ncbi:phosphogluconate dehydrogenase (NAD(+)-dependent, decarboxylating) [Lactococcus allomyrinae]|uniref:Decarboxylating 6-phosphogluconate dehydrogenase n=1 Tax=Lactococcus allomyrinae TaxID=2419773 RepID=A0A387BS20_9LACT|nr:decarboxylating 6-phosphogluconate dehydrogenase [Lactococcus allomyrinae]AYG01271.1 decarboxylating 6-phosphogluconate dehydrogenase [Lactococcus allomyrinae]